MGQEHFIQNIYRVVARSSKESRQAAYSQLLEVKRQASGELNTFILHLREGDNVSDLLYRSVWNEAGSMILLGGRYHHLGCQPHILRVICEFF